MATKTASAKKDYNVTVLREFARIGDYRVRLIENDRAAGKPAVLDVREYIQTERYTGWTRRGIRFHTRREAAELAETLKQVLEDAMLPDQTNGKEE